MRWHEVALNMFRSSGAVVGLKSSSARARKTEILMAMTLMGSPMLILIRPCPDGSAEAEACAPVMPQRNAVV